MKKKKENSRNMKKTRMWVGKVFQTKVQCLIKIDVRIYIHTHKISLPSIKKEKKSSEREKNQN